MNAERTARALGKACREGRSWRTNCPVHGGHSLVLTDGRDGRLLVKCWGGDCSVEEIFRELRALRLSSADDKQGPSVRSGPPVHTDEARRIARAQWIWDTAQDGRRGLVAAYLAGRGITIPPPPSLRWAARCRHPTGVCLSAMIGRIDSVDGELIGVHRTFLDGSRKAGIDPQKAMLGRAMGGAVRLAAAGPTLAITEGIETGLSVLHMSGIPTWAALSAGGIEALVLPSVVEAIIIYADHDHQGRGAHAAREAGQRWASEGRRVRLIMPTRPGSDFNDLLRELRNAAA
jgi:phage/plasmid primase-like uncharacterized protein